MMEHNQRPRAPSGSPAARVVPPPLVVAACWLLFLVFSGSTIRGAHSLGVAGSGEASVVDVYTGLGSAYSYSKDVISVSFTASTNVTTTLNALPAGRIYFVGTSSTVSRFYGGAVGSYAQIPVMATAMVAAYPTAVFSPKVAGAVLTLPTAVVAGMWNGTYTSWEDAGVVAPNVNMTLPNTTNGAASSELTIIYCNDVLGEGGVLANYLSAIDPGMAAVFAQRGAAGFAGLAAVTGGRAFSGCSVAAKQALLAAHPNSIVFTMYPDYKKNETGLAYARMTDRSGALVTLDAALTAVTKAMTTAASYDGSLVFDLTNQPNGSWPLAAMSSVVTYNYTTSGASDSIDCATIKEVLSFLSWTQINDNAILLIKNSGFIALSGRQRVNMLDHLSEVVCNGQEALTTAFLLGMGPAIPTYTSWATEYGSSGFTLKYFATSSVEGLASMGDNSMDFASTGAPLTPAQQATLPDVLTVPMVSYAFVFNYNMPELINTDYRITLSFQIVSDIYMNRIQTWDHPDILALNQEIAHLLPVNQPIIVTYFTTAQVTAQAINQALSLNVPEFAENIGYTGVPVYPVASEVNRTKPCATLNDATAAMRTPYALGQGVSFTALSSATLRPASMKINDTVLTPSRSSIVAGISNAASPTDLLILSSPGNGSWPMISTNALAVHSRDMVDCTKAKELVGWIYWTQTDPTAANIAQANKLIVAGQSAPVKRAMLNFIANITCDGEPVSALAYCITQGTICSDHGACFSSKCVCDDGWKGTYCESPVTSDSSSSSDVVVPLLASFLPVLAGLIVLGLLLGFFLYWRLRHLKKKDEWEIPYSEVDLGDPLGQGGYGSVYKSEWRGTQVAVKVLIDGRVTKEMERSFHEEVSIMSSLRHPNVVLFMGACTKPPHLFIIMEYMALGSLFDLLHNELVPDIPALLRTKMLYQAAKGMHFLHSSGVVHCDLKSLNLLLDSKWNLKVSDFGLTKVKGELLRNGSHSRSAGAVGTIHWTAPEVLAESDTVDYVLADIYSYGIVMWETFTRQQPYDGMSPAAIAVSVLRNNYRPPIPEGYDLSALPMGLLDDVSFSSNTGSHHSAFPGASSQSQSQAFNGRYVNSPEYDQDLKYLHLMTQCWHQDPVMRPSFLEIMTQLSTNDYGGGSKSGGSSSSSSSMASYPDIRRMQARRNHDGQSTLASTNSDPLSSSASLNSGSMEMDAKSGIHIPAFKYKVKIDEAGNLVGRYGTNEAMLSSDNVAAVFLDVTSAHVLWQRAPEAMVETMLLYNELVRAVAVRHHGHETMVGDRGNSEGSMCLLFNDPEAACMMCFDLQKELLDLPWPKKLLAVPQAQEVTDPVTENVVFRGLRVRCGIHVGRIAAKRGNDIRKAGLKHSGPAIEAAMKLASVAKPGQIVISANVRNRLIESGLVKKKKSTKAADDGDQVTGKKRDDAKSIKTNFLRKVELPTSAPRASGSYAAEDVRLSEDRNGRERGDSDSMADVKAFEMKVPGLYRFFENEGADDSENSERDGSSSQQVQVARHGRATVEGDAETWLNSANMCPWIIDYSKVTVYDDKPLGSGSYGVVYRGKWQNVDIAVKRFIKQTMNERHILEFRSEMSILSGLHHPNIITFVGACVVEPNLCIITEYMKNGNLRHILSSSVKLSFNDRMRMLLHTAQGLQYLHDTVSPSIIHRDLKCSNILVDETNGVWTVKIADFGFARVKETNTTMTRCGTPSWIAPEIIRGEKYTEKADIYSLAIIMWEVLTRRVPYEGLNFMAVSLHVLDNNRPEIPDNCPADFKKMMTRCWHPKAHKRPSITDVVGFFKQLVGASPFDV